MKDEMKDTLNALKKDAADLIDIVKDEVVE